MIKDENELNERREKYLVQQKLDQGFTDKSLDSHAIGVASLNGENIKNKNLDLKGSI